ncbi:response regulator transcription factor [Paenibacillus sp. UNC451MF]|uniref:response regulator transcription factor n=1 Tax=Paenibacillus sp. UNC451MF TaxID=1449063 RepID=UPI00048DC515|nr:response regulator [Paenibacillus sp. UNC451MF]
MFHLLIVDDEMHAVKMIESCIEWEQLSISHIHVAYNIRQAQKMYEQFPIDLMICDIEMPQGSGIDLLTWVRDYYPNSESVFLTCHSDFNYAKKAVALGSLDYLLKPVQFDELKQVVHRGLSKVMERKQQQDIQEKSQYYTELWKTQQPLVLERFWQDVFHQRIATHPASIYDAIRTNHLPIDEQDQFIPILISIQRWTHKFTLREERMMEYALQNTAEYSILHGSRSRQITWVTADMLLVIVPVDEQQQLGKSELVHECETYMSACTQYFGCELSCYVGDRGQVTSLAKQFEGLLELRKNNISPTNKVIFYNDCSQNSDEVDIIEMNVWLELLKRGAYHSILAGTDQYLTTLMNREQLSAQVLQKFLQSFLQIMYHFIQSKGLLSYQVLGELTSTEQLSQAVRSVTDLKTWVRQTLELTIVSCRTEHTLMSKIKGYVMQHLDQPISREDIAKYVNLHPDYLSRWYKKETQKSIMEYITEEKVRVAKEMLLTTDLSVSDIAMSVGYSNFSYFSKVFKHVVSMNPNEYRKTKSQNNAMNKSV